MAFLDWLIIGGVGLLIRSQIKKNAEACEEDEDKYESYICDLQKDRIKSEKQHENYMQNLRSMEAEWDRRRNVNKARRAMPCLFCDGLEYTDFSTLATKAAKHIKRIKDIDVQGAIVYGTVESQTGLSDWQFNVDFNNWGHVTGTYWTWTDNEDSSIPKHYGNILSSLIHDFLRDNRITLNDFSDAVDDNQTLGTDIDLDSKYHEGVIKRLFRIGYSSIEIPRSADFYRGEHIYPVISLLKQYGFVNIKSIAIEDVDDQSNHFIYEVAGVQIEENTAFQSSQKFMHNAEIIIYYHTKKKISVPKSFNRLKQKNYIEVGNYLRDLGFTQIYERQIKDLIIGLIRKNGSVESVLVDEGDEVPIRQGESYLYDAKIVITYHTRRQ